MQQSILGTDGDQGPDMGKCRPGASRKVPPRPPPKSANPQRALAIPVLLMVYFRHNGPYQANTNKLIKVVR